MELYLMHILVTSFLNSMLSPRTFADDLQMLNAHPDLQVSAEYPSTESQKGQEENTSHVSDGRREGCHNAAALAEGIRTDLITLGPFSATHMACIVGKVSKLILILYWSVQCR